MLIGHQRIWNFLTGSFVNNKLAHACLFVGPPQIGKKTIALELAKLVQCQNQKPEDKKRHYCGTCEDCRRIEKGYHPDVILIEQNSQASAKEQNEPSEQTLKNNEIKIGQIRDLQHQISLSPFSAQYKFVILDSAQHLTQEAANCLLKTLEEPPQKSILVLIASSWQKLLPTITSRCQVIKFLPVKSEEITQGLKKMGYKDEQIIKQAVRFSCGLPGRAIRFAGDAQLREEQKQIVDNLEKLTKKDLAAKFKYARELAQNVFLAQEALDNWLIWFRDRMLYLAGAGKFSVFKEGKSEYSLSKTKELLEKIQETKNLLEEPSFNARLILENLMLKI